jgi:hypothetical protein
MISRQDHSMSLQISGYRDGDKSGVDIVREWILSLPS